MIFFFKKKGKKIVKSGEGSHCLAVGFGITCARILPQSRNPIL